MNGSSVHEATGINQQLKHIITRQKIVYNNNNYDNYKHVRRHIKFNGRIKHLVNKNIDKCKKIILLTANARWQANEGVENARRKNTHTNN